MKIFYGFPLFRLQEFQHKYRATIDLILGLGNEITRDWLDKALLREKSNIPHPPISRLCTAIFGSIKESDICIFDATAKSMGLGQQIMASLQSRRPTLLVIDVRHEDSIVDRLMIGGYKSHYLTLRDYSTDEEMLQHVREFIEKHRDARDQRMTLSIDEDTFDSLSQTATKKDEPLRFVIEGQIEEYRENLKE